MKLPYSDLEKMEIITNAAIRLEEIFEAFEDGKILCPNGNFPCFRLSETNLAAQLANLKTTAQIIFGLACEVKAEMRKNQK